MHNGCRKNAIVKLAQFSLCNQIISHIHNDVNKKMAALFWGTLIFSSTDTYGEIFLIDCKFSGGIRYGSLTSRYGIKIVK